MNGGSGEETVRYRAITIARSEYALRHSDTTRVLAITITEIIGGQNTSRVPRNSTEEEEEGGRGGGYLYAFAVVRSNRN